MLTFIASTTRALFRRQPAFPLTLQHDEFDCGPACLHMIARHYGKTVPLQRLRERSDIDRQGVSLRGISAAAEEIGFRTRGVKVTFEQLSRQVHLPCIVHWRQKHFVVVYAVDDRHVSVADPASGLVSYPKAEFLRGWYAGRQDGEASGIALLVEPTPAVYEHEDEPQAPSNGFGLLWSYVKPHRRLNVQLLIGLVAVSLMQLFFPFLTQALVDVGIAQQNLHFIYVVLIAQLMLVFSRSAVDFIQSWIVLHVNARVDISMISDFLGKLMRLPAAFFDAKTTGDLLQRIQDHSRIQAFLSGASLHVLLSLISLIVFGAVLMLFSTTIFLVFLAGSLLYIGYILAFLKRRRELDYRRFSQLSENQNLLIETIGGMQEIKLNNAERQQRWGWERLQARLFRISLKGLALEQHQKGGAVLIHEVKNVVITVIAAQQVINGTLSLGTLLAIQYIIGQLNGPLDQLITFLHTTQDAKISLDRMAEVRDLDDEEREHHLTFMPERPDLVLRQVSFRYGGAQHRPVLDDLDLTIDQGKVTAVVGTSGSGKTTLMKLLLRIYEPQNGEIRLGGVALRNLSHRLWRDQCGVVMQDGHVFSDTIARNIALGEETVDQARLLHAVKVACIQEFIESLPLAYNTRIGRNGVGLSMGQQQRVLIARAVYKNPSYLFFDEATSALDAETERAITENLQPFFEGRTVLVIAHRLSTVRKADQIVVLEGGRIVERGPHEELVARQGRYFHLVKNQLELAG